jgi:hypothetical protein
LISSKAKRSVSLRDVSLIAIVPLNECNIPTLIVSALQIGPTASADALRMNVKSFFFMLFKCG